MKYKKTKEESEYVTVPKQFNKKRISKRNYSQAF